MKAQVVNEQETETLSTIYNRRAVRRFKKLPVNNIVLEKIIAAGCMAPSAMNHQPWKFYVTTRPSTIDLFSKEITEIVIDESMHSGLRGLLKLVAGALYGFYYGGFRSPNLFYHAPVVVFIAAPKDNPWACYDIGMCAQNMMLAARSIGFDTCPIGIGKYIGHTPSYTLLEIPENEEVHLAISIGYGDERPSPHKRASNNIVYVDQRVDPVEGKP